MCFLWCLKTAGAEAGLQLSSVPCCSGVLLTNSCFSACVLAAACLVCRDSGVGFCRSEGQAFIVRKVKEGFWGLPLERQFSFISLGLSLQFTAGIVSSSLVGENSGSRPDSLLEAGKKEFPSIWNTVRVSQPVVFMTTSLWLFKTTHDSSRHNCFICVLRL